MRWCCASGVAFGNGEASASRLLRHKLHLHRPLGRSVVFMPGCHIGSEGPGLSRGLGCALHSPRASTLIPWYVTMPFAIVGAPSGAALGFHPACFRPKRGSHIVITTIMSIHRCAGDGLPLAHVLIVPGKMAPEPARS